ncbi:SLC45 family MFS transporter [Novosphingobium sp. ERN07]|uniref:MFS transporter n=1 Tax=Novosphingobium sp. ERN07 TaxID=2726187 RepID=UPI00145704E0|nr:MFS transporter [Novosphingobium sp. ERN07]NLR69951.1 SLC45 family MFS transporter [Novosphingobium sp. ERN07]
MTVHSGPVTTHKPRQGFWGLWNISFGYFGIQIAFALQNANVSRIFQSLGSSVDDLAFLWIAGPVTGLLVQPLIGYYSDRTWGRLGRRRPYFLGGAVLAALALIGLPSAGLLLVAAAFLWMLDASLNVAMEPFRAFAGDMTPDEQRGQAFAFQTAFIGAGAVLGSLAPALFNWLGIANTAPDGTIPPSVCFSFSLGAVAIVLSVGWTVFRVREYAPEEMAAFEGQPAHHHDAAQHEPLVHPRSGPLWVIAGAALLALVGALNLDKQLYVLGAGLALFGMIQIGVRTAGAKGALAHIVSDLAQMPLQMKQLAFAQFFTWIGFFIVWIYTTPVVTAQAFGATDTASAAYNEGADWVGVMFAFYNGVSILAAFLLPVLARHIGNAATHAIGLLCGAGGFLGLLLIRDPHALLLPMIGMGVAWASVLSMPYVILTRVLPPRKFGIYIGIFNFFIVIPQLVVATLMGGIMRSFFPGEPRWTMLVAALMMAMAATAMTLVRENAKDVT